MGFWGFGAHARAGYVWVRVHSCLFMLTCAFAVSLIVLCGGAGVRAMWCGAAVHIRPTVSGPTLLQRLQSLQPAKEFSKSRVTKSVRRCSFLNIRCSKGATGKCRLCVLRASGEQKADADCAAFDCAHVHVEFENWLSSLDHLTEFELITLIKT